MFLAFHILSHLVAAQIILVVMTFFPIHIFQIATKDGSLVGPISLGYQIQHARELVLVYPTTSWGTIHVESISPPCRWLICKIIIL
jgi:hypothetical protein